MPTAERFTLGIKYAVSHGYYLFENYTKLY